MNQYEYDNFCDFKFSLPNHHILGKDLENQEPRTLIYGYTLDRESFHVYLNFNNIIEIYLYGYENIALSHFYEDSDYTNNEYVPSKRVYPESCDFEFCKLLRSYNIQIPFTTFDIKRYEKVKDKRYHGYTYKYL